jgi:hypothetical protein
MSIQQIQSRLDADAGLEEIQARMDEEPYTEATLAENGTVVIAKIGGVPGVRHAETRAQQTYQLAGQVAEDTGVDFDTTHHNGTAEATFRFTSPEQGGE